MEKINRTLKNIESIDNSMIKMAESRLDTLTKPKGSLGRLEELA
ncbi:MAG: nicotinate-nucleotide--dimethylbenzimidazole phosphoribosyltransferase, partial [bacterium]|nr:nicotinate-nucleotide--dimethylbenzimidazole phosphoribosyltransferase [bacterium]